MSWYKKAQSITLDNVIWAIDKIIAEKYDFSEEELLQASNDFNQQWQSKAAQTVKTKKTPKGYSRSPKTWPMPGSNKSLEEEVLEIFNKGAKPRDIASQLGITASEVSKILKKYYPSKREQIDYLTKKHEGNILDFTQQRAEEMRNDFNIISITIEDIAEELDIAPKFIGEILLKNKIKLKDFVAERRDRMAKIIVGIVNNLNYQPETSEVISIFFQQHNYKLSQHSANSAMVLNNAGVRAQQNPAAIFQAFTTFINDNVRGGVKSFIDRPENLPVIIDNFFISYGKHHGFAPPISKDVLKNMLMTKIQLKERTEENMMNRSNPNRYTPIVTDETHPSYFLQNQEASAKSWYKKAQDIPGDMADKKKPSDFSSKELEKGKRIEKEHTKDKGDSRRYCYGSFRRVFKLLYRIR